MARVAATQTQGFFFWLLPDWTSQEKKEELNKKWEKTPLDFRQV